MIVADEIIHVVELTLQNQTCNDNTCTSHIHALCMDMNSLCMNVRAQQIHTHSECMHVHACTYHFVFMVRAPVQMMHEVEDHQLSLLALCATCGQQAFVVGKHRLLL